MKKFFLVTLVLGSQALSAEDQIKGSSDCPSVCFENGLPLNLNCLPEAYSAPAAIRLTKGWNTFVNVSYLYYEAIQGGMDLGIPYLSNYSDGIYSDFVTTALGYPILMQDFSYKSGFQVGIGSVCPNDNWVLYAEYTWLHGSSHTYGTPPNANVNEINGYRIPQTGLYNPTSFFAGGEFANGFASTIESNWKYKVDLVDAQVSRPYYLGTNYIMEPFFGLRGAFIRQNLNLAAGPVTLESYDPFQPVWKAHYSSHSNGIGPRCGFNGNWYLGYGIHFIGNLGASLLFTGYKVSQNVNSPQLSYPIPTVSKINNFNTLRPNAELSIGLGWNSYFSCRRVHFNLEALYDFSIFWEQNMIRYLADLTNSNNSWSGSAPGNLFLEGLVIKTGLNF